MKTLTLLALLLIIIPTALAHAGEQTTAMDNLVRVVSANPENTTYTFSCDILEDGVQDRLWSLREEGSGESYFEVNSINDTLTTTFPSVNLFHVTCETVKQSNYSVLYRGDFHIDMREELNPNKSHVMVMSTNATDFTAMCVPPQQAVNQTYSWRILGWTLNEQLSQFDGQDMISYNVPEPGLYDIVCEVSDESETYEASGLPVEFFSEGPAYVPNPTGCMPWECASTIYNVPENLTAPTIDLTVIASGDGYELLIYTTDFTIVEGPITHVHGEGHIHWYIDGVKQGRIYNNSFYTEAIPAGEHVVSVRFATNDHKEYAINNIPIEDSEVVVVSDGESILAPQWLEPSLGKTNVDPLDFHIQVFEPVLPQGVVHIATDFEMYEVERNVSIWKSINDTEILYHIHNVDGVWQGNTLEDEERLDYDTEYRLRVRFHLSNGNSTEWSEWRNFKTRTEYVFDDSPYLWTAREGYTVELVSSGIAVPVNVRMAPDLYNHLPESEQPLLYVTQLYGKVSVVYKNGTNELYADNLLNYQSFGSIPGSGETGVDGLYVDPDTGDLFVSLVYSDPVSGFRGKVVRFYTNGDGNGFVSNETILSGIPVAPSHMTHTISRGPDGKLYLHVGDDDQPSKAKDPNFMSGKILRFNDDGSMPADNPFPGTYVYAAGFRNHFGGAWRPGTNEYYVSNNGPDENDGVYKVLAGETKGWCCDTGEDLWHFWPETVAPVAVEFDTVNFSDGGSDVEPVNHENGVFFVASSAKTYLQGQSPNAKRIHEFHIGPDGEKQLMEDLVTYTGPGFASPIGLAMAEDALYFTDIYGEQGFVGVGLTNGNVYRVVRGNQSNETQSNESGTLSAGLSIGPWFPQGLNVVWECKAFDGSGNYLYDYYFGDGNQQLNSPNADVWHTYAQNGTYQAGCTVHDLDTQESASTQTTLVLGDDESGDVGNGTIVISKVVINDNEGVKTVNDFTYFINGQPVAIGVPYSYPIGEYTITEGNTEGYIQSFSADCDSSGVLVLGANETKTCTITNNDIFVNDSVGNESMCYSSLENMPVSCSGGIVTQDTYNGCRQIICAESEDSLTYLQVLACDKPDALNPTHFEMYRQQQTGGSFEICLGETCMSNQGYVKSTDYPYCTVEEPVCTDGDGDTYYAEGGVCGTLDCRDDNSSINPSIVEICDGIDNNCNGIADEDGVCESAICGDGNVDLGEECDDGNNDGNDGCSASCIAEEVYNLEEGDPVISVRLDVVENDGSYTLFINSTNMTLVDLGASMAPHVVGEGHFHWYLNGVKMSRVYSYEYEIGALPVGTHTVEIRVGTNMHLEYAIDGVRISDNETVVVGNAPMCGDGTINQASEQCDDGNLNNEDGCSSTCQVEEAACYESVETMPVSCSGTISSDTFNGCRSIVCSGKQILACDKGSNFEMYNQGGSDGVEICLGETCMSNQGYVASDAFPICVGEPVEPICGDGAVNQVSEQCDDGNVANNDGCSAACQIEEVEPICGDGAVNQESEMCDDGNLDNGDGCSSTCQIEEPQEGNVTLSFAPWYPQENNAVLVCSAPFTPTTIDWYFGDGNSWIGSNRVDVWHTYPGSGSYEASCVAHDGLTSGEGTLTVLI